MGVTSGFFNSINGDRRYNAEQMSSIFDGIINDGVFMNIGTAFGVKAGVGNNITVGTGRAWFDSTWLYNDAILPMAADDSEILLDRYDAVVIEINHTNAVRAGQIIIVKGTPAIDPQKPTLVDSADVHQHPLAYIYRRAESQAITQADIENTIGTSVCPYVTGILETASIDNIVAQWQAEMEQWTAEEQQEFNTWFEAIKGTLSDDAATALAAAVQELQARVGTLEARADVIETDLSGLSFRVVSSLPSNPDSNTVYLIGES